MVAYLSLSRPTASTPTVLRGAREEAGSFSGTPDLVKPISTGVSIQQTMKALLMEGPGEASLGLLSGSMRVTYTQNPHGSLGSEDRWGEPHLGSRCLRPQSKSVGSLDLYLSSSLGLGVLICGWEAWYHPANLTEMAGQHEMRG